MLKRAIDVVGATVGLVLLSPLLALVAVLVRWRLGAPVLWWQERLGRGEVMFRLVKFRTMTNERDAAGALLPDEQRLTAFGQRLRSASLDELPELWNVLRGDMSLVGPRPLPVAYLHRYTAEERRRHDVRPGLTGLAQVRGRNLVGWDERLALDVWYVDHASVLLDARILARTVLTVFRRHGISAEGEATMRVLRPELADSDDSA